MYFCYILESTDRIAIFSVELVLALTRLGKEWVDLKEISVAWRIIGEQIAPAS